MEDKEKGEERRKYVRVNKNIPVRITVPDVGGEGIDAHLASVTRNVSIGGVQIEFAAIREEMWSKLKTPDLVLSLEMFFPDYDERISVQARVQWVEEANKLLAQYAKIGLSIIEDEEINKNLKDLYAKLKQLVDIQE